MIRLSEVCDVYEDSDYIVDERAIASEFLPDRQPPRSAYLLVSISGVTSSGTVTINQGAETLSFSGDDVLQSAYQYASVTGFSVSGFASGTISVRAVDSVGNPLRQDVLKYSNLPCTLVRPRPEDLVPTPGREIVSTLLIFVDDWVDIRLGQRITVGTVSYEVMSVTHRSFFKRVEVIERSG